MQAAVGLARPDRQALAAAVSVALVAAIVGVAAVVSPVLALAAAAGLTFTALAFRNFALGFAAFVVLTFFDRIPGAQGSGVTLVKIAGVVIGLAWIIAILRRRDSSTLVVQHAVIISATALLVLWALSSVLWARDFDAAASGSLRFLQVSLLLFIVIWSVEEAKHVLWIVWAYLAGAMLTSISGFTGAYAEAGGRLQGDIGDPNQLAAVLIPAISLAGFTFLALRGHSRRWLAALPLPVFGVVLTYTDSQGGLVAFAALILLTLFFAGSARRQATSAILVFVAFAIVYYAFVTPPVGIQTLTQGGGSGREDLWRVAVRVADDHTLAGVGSANFPAVEADYTLGDFNLQRIDLVSEKREAVHNMYLEILAELGVVGLVAFLTVAVASLVSGYRAVRMFARRGNREMELLARSAVIGLGAMLVASIFLSTEFFKQLWILLGLGPALLSLALRAQSSFERS